MKIIFYVHWASCLAFMMFVAMFDPNGFGREKVIFGFGSAFMLCLAVIYNGYDCERKRNNVSMFYYFGNLISCCMRAAFEMAIFIYGSALRDKWILICLFGGFVTFYMLFDKFVIREHD